MKSLVHACVDALGADLARGWPGVVLATTAFPTEEERASMEASAPSTFNPFGLTLYDPRFHSVMPLEALATRSPAWARGADVLGSMGIVAARVDLGKLARFLGHHAGPGTFLARDSKLVGSEHRLFGGLPAFEAGVHRAVYFAGPGVRYLVSAARWLADRGVYAVRVRGPSKRKGTPRRNYVRSLR